MKTFTLMCRVFYGAVAPEYNAQELELLKACDQTYEQLAKCEDAEKMIRAIKRVDASILTSCSPNQ
jgi:hypothetical protein